MNKQLTTVITVVVIVVAVVAVAAYVLTIPSVTPTPTTTTSTTTTTTTTTTTPVEKFKIACVIPVETTDLDWSQGMYEALMKLKAKPEYEITYVEGIYEPADAEVYFRSYAEEGYNLIIGHGFQFPEVNNKVAKDFPNQVFLNTAAAPPENANPNFILIQNNDQESGYAIGVLSARMTKTNHIGYITAYDVGGIHLARIGFEEGAKSINPDIVIDGFYTGDFRDVAAGKEAALGMADAGADVIFALGDGISWGIISGCKEKGVYATTMFWDKSSLAPETVLWSTSYLWDVMIENVVPYIKAGTLPPPEFRVMSIASGATFPNEFNSAVPAEVKAEVLDVWEKIRIGEFVPEVWW